MRLCKIHRVALCSDEHAVTKVNAVPPLYSVHPRFIQGVVLWHRHKLNSLAASQAKKP